MMTRNSFAPIVVLLVVASAASLTAHEFWLSAAPWQVAPGGTASILIHVGERFPNPTSFTPAERVDRVRLIGPVGEIAVTPVFHRQNLSLAAPLPLPSEEGTYIGAVIVKPRFILIEPSDFVKYVQAEGLDTVVKERARRGESARPGRERYSRYGKTLFRRGQAAGEHHGHVTRPIGMKVELIPLSDPTRLEPGARCRFRLLFEGEPVVGVIVSAIFAGAKVGPDEWPLRERTDVQGEVEFALADPGPWLIRSVHMVRRGGESGAEAADWESYWASLSFSLESR